MTNTATVASGILPTSPKRLVHHGAIFVALLVVHEALKRVLADGAIVSALFSPGGAHSIVTLLVALLLIIVRLTLFVGVPGVLGATALARLHRVVRGLR
jgi:hypothetical protein